MCWLKTRILSVLFAAAATSLVLAADTGTPYPAGTSVEIRTPAGTVSNVLAASWHGTRAVRLHFNDRADH